MTAFEGIVPSFITLLTFLGNYRKLIWETVTLLPFFYELFPYCLKIFRFWLIFVTFKDWFCFISSCIIESLIKSNFELTLGTIFYKRRRFITFINFSKPITAIIWRWLENYVFTHTLDDLFTLFAFEDQRSKFSCYLYCFFLVRILPLIEFDHIWRWYHQP